MQLIRVKLQDCLFKRIFSEGINELLSGDWHWDIISSILDRILSITPRFTYGLKEYAQSPGLPVSPFQSSGLADRDCSFDFSLRLPLPSLRFLRCALDRQDRQDRRNDRKGRPIGSPLQSIFVLIPASSPPFAGRAHPGLMFSVLGHRSSVRSPSLRSGQAPRVTGPHRSLSVQPAGLSPVSPSQHSGPADRDCHASRRCTPVRSQ